MDESDRIPNFDRSLIAHVRPRTKFMLVNKCQGLFDWEIFGTIEEAHERWKERGFKYGLDEQIVQVEVKIIADSGRYDPYERTFFPAPRLSPDGTQVCEGE